GGGASRGPALPGQAVGGTARSVPAGGPPAVPWVPLPLVAKLFAHDRSIIFCRFLTFGQSPSRAAVKILCRSRATFCSWSAQLMTSHSLTPSGPFAVSGIQLALRLG